MRTNQHVDLTGKPIYKDDFIVYAAAAGRSAVLHLGKVVGLTFAKREETWNGEDHVAPFHPATVQVQGASKGWSKREPWRPNSKIVTLQYPDRTAVIDSLSLDREAIAAIESVGVK